MTRQPNSKYWKERSIERLAAVERGTPKYLNEIQHMYESAAREIRENIAGIIGNYAKNADLTVTEAFEILRTPVTAEEIEKLKVIAGSIPDKIERAKALARLNAPAYAARISRQQAVLESTRLELARLAPGQVQTITTALTEAAHEGFNRTVFDIQQGFGLGYTFNQVSSGQIEEVLKQKWSGRHYSKRVWDNTEVLADRVKSVIKQNMITGRSWRRSLDEVNDIVKSGGLYSAKRLLQTETAYVANEMEAEAYEDADIDKYEFVATLDGRTSQICQEKDGKIYKLKDRKPGVNYPPLHAHCRSTTVAVVEGFDTSELERRARDPVTGKNVLVPADMKYKDWKESLTQDQRKAISIDLKKTANLKRDQDLYFKYKSVFGKEVGKNIQDFQALKYKDPDKWLNFKNEKQNKINSMTIEELKPLKGKLGNYETRSWYKTNVEKIPDAIKSFDVLEEKAYEAFVLRNKIRTDARDLMVQQNERMILDTNCPNKSFDELVTSKMQRKNMTRTEALRDIIKTATETNVIVNEQLGL